MENALSRLRAWKESPNQFISEALGIAPEPWQERALNGLVKHGRVSIRSGHGVGKSALDSWAVLWFLLTHFPAKIPCTAPTAHQLQDILWSELGKWHRRLPEWLRNELELGSDRMMLRGAPEQSFAVARTARKEQPEALQGFHSENLLFVIDEASGVEDIVFEVAEGALSTPNAKVLMTANPTRTSGYFHDSHNKMRDRWYTMRVSCSDSSQVSDTYAKEMAEKYGEDSNIYRVRVLGEFPRSEDDVVIPLDLVESALSRLVSPVTGYLQIWGMDVARFGEDRTTLAKRHSNILVEPVKSWQGKDLMQTAGILKLEYEQAEPKPSEILIDSIGLGAGVVDRCIELGLPVRGVNVGESAAVSNKYMRLRDELWFKAREWFDAKDCHIENDDELIAELTGPKYKFTSSGKIQVESKDDMKKRGIRSPDKADAFCLTFAGGLERMDDRKYDRYNRKPKNRASGWAT